MQAAVSDVEAELERLRAIKAGSPRPPPLTLEQLRAREMLPHASVARGGSKFTWAVWSCSDAVCHRAEHIAEGSAASMADADAQIRSRFPDFVMWGSGPAHALRHRRAVERRAAKAPTGASDAKPLEFLYRYSFWPTERWVRHRVVSKTATRVYVDRHADGETRDPALPPLEAWRMHEVLTRIVDRRKLELTGRAEASELGELLTEAAMASIDPSAVGGPTACLADLGLVWPTTRAAVRKAFRRLAKTVHPDHGGSSEAFIELRTAYDAALRLVGGA